MKKLLIWLLIIIFIGTASALMWSTVSRDYTLPYAFAQLFDNTKNVFLDFMNWFNAMFYQITGSIGF